MPEQRVRVIVDIGYEDFRPYYDGRVKDVVAPGTAGQKVRFPASALRPYLTHTGISGIFEIRMDENNRLVSCERVGDIA